MYTPIYDGLIRENQARSRADQEEFVQSVEATLAQIDAGTFEVTATKNLTNPLRFWAKEYRAFVEEYRSRHPKLETL